MKHTTFSLLLAAVLLAGACHTGKTPITTTDWEAADSTAYAYLSMHIALPDADKGPAKQIRQELTKVMDGQLSCLSPGEQERCFPPYSGPSGDTDALLSYYKDQVLAQIGKLSQEDAEDRIKYMDENPDITPGQKAGLIAEIPKWSYDFTLKKVLETPQYAVFLSQNYIYMGGAHGGVTGAGYLTFDKRDGHRVDPVIDTASTQAIQPLLVRGLLQYYKEAGVELTREQLLDQLFLSEDGIIPLPSWTPHPTEEGLSFVYQQYEIASYAEGMPSFILPYAEAAPFLTPDARNVLGGKL